VSTSLKGRNCKVGTSLHFSIYYTYHHFSYKFITFHFSKLFIEKIANFFLRTTQRSHQLFSTKMDLLSDDLIINIAARVAAHNMYHLFYFQRTNKRHAELCRDPIVSKSFDSDCIFLLTDLDLTPEKLSFMDLLWDHGNPMFCILRCSQHMLHPTPNLNTIRCLLANAEAAPSQSAKYFHILIRATAPPLLDEEGLMNDLWALLMTRRLQRFEWTFWDVRLLLGFTALGTRDSCP
jgi:hypothetical protein